MSLRLTDAERDLALQPERTLSRVPPGHWRCVFRITDPLMRERAGTAKCGCIYRADGEVVDCTRYISREVADENGARDVSGCCGIVYVRAEYFPGERP